MASTPRGRPKFSAYAVHTRNSQKKKEAEDTDVSSPNASPEFKSGKESTSNTAGRKRKLTNENVADASKKDSPNPTKMRTGKKVQVEEDDRNASNQNLLEEERSSSEINGDESRKGDKRKARIRRDKKDHSKATNGDFAVEIMSDEEELSSNEINETTLLSTSTPTVPGVFSGISCGNEMAEEAVGWLLHPVKPKAFFEKKWEKMPIHIHRTNQNYYRGLFSMKEFDKIIKENLLQYGDEIDVVSYSNGKRIPITSDMRVYPSFVWNAFQEGNSLRMRNPQAYSKALWNLCSLLQEYFSSDVGANMYLTPPDSQGFPPHYDDIDAFILQIEGRKIWKLYKPRNENEVLPRYSSGDLKEDEIGTPIMEVEVKPGDMLYFPRGFIHQAKAASGEHSLHITISTNQLNTYGDLIQAGFSNALQNAITNNVEFRESLPKDYVDLAGSAYSDCDSAHRQAFQKHVMDLVRKAALHFSVDHAVDVHSANYIQASMPPAFNRKEKSCSIHGNGARIEKGELVAVADITPETKVRWIRKRAFRLTMDEKGAQLLYTLSNDRNHREEGPLSVEVDEDLVPAICVLFKTHPNYIKIKDLPIECLETRLSFAAQLYEYGFLVTEEPLPLAEDGDDF